MKFSFKLPNKVTSKLPWKKTDQDLTEVQPQINDYYKEDRPARTPVAWLLAFASLVLTILIAFGAFFAGRWVYRQIVDSGSDETTVVTAPSNQPAQPTNKSKTNKSNKSSSSSTSATANSNLAETGPGNVVAIFVISAALGTGFYQYKLRRSAN